MARARYGQKVRVAIVEGRELEEVRRERQARGRANHCKEFGFYSSWLGVEIPIGGAPYMNLLVKWMIWKYSSIYRFRHQSL